MAKLQDFRCLLRRRVPGQLVIQLTDRCNAHCPQCGMRVTEKYRRSTLAVDDVKRMLDHAVSMGVRAVSFTGAEPLLHLDDLLTLINYAGKAGIPYVRTGTNGFHLLRGKGGRFSEETRQLAERLAATPLRNLWISIDSADPGTHERMRGLPGIISAIAQGLPAFHECGISRSANLGINRNVDGQATAQLHGPSSAENGNAWEPFVDAYRRAFRRLFRLVVDMGFTIANVGYPMSIDQSEQGDRLKAVYAATAEDHLVRYTALEKAHVFKAFLEATAESRSEIRIFSPRSSLYALSKQHGRASDACYPCRGHELFVKHGLGFSLHVLSLPGRNGEEPLPSQDVAPFDVRLDLRRPAKDQGHRLHALAALAQEQPPQIPQGMLLALTPADLAILATPLL